MSTHPGDTTETYLRTIFNIAEDGIAVRKIRLSERLGQAGPTVSQTVGRLERNGFLWISPGHQIVLTPAGNEIAVAVTRRHRIAERMLVDILKLPARLAHAEADQWEHALSEETERRIVTLIDNPSLSPWGNPIPGLAALGVSAPEPTEYARLADLEQRISPHVAVVRCISEDAQSDSTLMANFIDAGIIPGAQVEVRASATTFVIRGLNEYILPAKLSHVLRVELVDVAPAPTSRERVPVQVSRY